MFVVPIEAVIKERDVSLRDDCFDVDGRFGVEYSVGCIDKIYILMFFYFILYII